MDLYELDSAITEGEIAYAATADWEEARALREALYILQIVKGINQALTLRGVLGSLTTLLHLPQLIGKAVIF